jgi:hypothetical protein
MSHASRSAHIADLIDLYLAQVADLREFAQATDAGKAPCTSKMPSASRKSAGPTSTGSWSRPPSPRRPFR